jgi:hypothetical protein
LAIASFVNGNKSVTFIAPDWEWDVALTLSAEQYLQTAQSA